MTFNPQVIEFVEILLGRNEVLKSLCDTFERYVKVLEEGVRMRDAEIISLKKQIENNNNHNNHNNLNNKKFLYGNKEIARTGV